MIFWKCVFWKIRTDWDFCEYFLELEKTVGNGKKVDITENCPENYETVENTLENCEIVLNNSENSRQHFEKIKNC